MQLQWTYIKKTARLVVDGLLFHQLDILRKAPEHCLVVQA